MAKILTQKMDVPKNTVRWYVKKDKELNNQLSQAFNALRNEKNCQFRVTTSELPNGKTRVTTTHRYSTQADVDAHLAILSPYIAERDAYHAENNIDFTQTITEE
jgi:hypothetical protein